MVGPRRSKRTACASYESNGRDYLAAELQLSRQDLEFWLASPSVHPHLLLWYNLCIVGSRRFNEAIDWINTGSNGYFYNKSDLEEDLLLMCLGEGNHGGPEGNQTDHSDGKARTSGWATQEIWGRAAWRIVQSNCGKGQLFERAVIQHPAAAYAIAIDILCIAFHSIAFRKSESIWQQIILNGNSGNSDLSVPTTAKIAIFSDSNKQIELDMNSSDGAHSDSESTSHSNETSESSFADDETFIVPRTPEPDGEEMIVTPKAPKKIQTRSNTAADLMQNWLESLPDAEGAGDMGSRD